MHIGKKFSFRRVLLFSQKEILFFILVDSIPVILYDVFGFDWIHIPWQPMSLLGIAVAFYLGFKNNSSYERLWEARKIWGGIVNASRSFTVMARDYITTDDISEARTNEELTGLRKQVIHRHVAWLHCLALELRKLTEWEHRDQRAHNFRKELGLIYDPENFKKLQPYLSDKDYQYIMKKDNKSSHILSTQSRHLMQLRSEGIIDHFRHLKMQDQITEFYALQGKSERIKNFPFPRQYATVNYFFVVLFVLLLPFAMLDIFQNLGEQYSVWLAIPFSVLASWVFWMMELVGDYSENPFEGLVNDVPITSMAVGIERDIRQMLDETDLPEPPKPILIGALKVMP